MAIPRDENKPSAACTCTPHRALRAPEAERPTGCPARIMFFGNHFGERTDFRNGYALGQSADWKKQRGVLVLLSTTGGPPPAGLPILRAGDAAWKAR